MAYKPIKFQYDDEGLPYIYVSENERNEFKEKENLFTEKLADDGVNLGEAMKMLDEYSHLDPLKHGIKEGIRDAELLQKFQEVAKHNVDLLNTNCAHFDNGEFVRKMISILNPRPEGQNSPNNDDDDSSHSVAPPVTRKQLNLFGESVRPYFTTTPAVKIMMGLLSKQKKVRKRIERGQKSKNSKATIITPHMMKDFKEVETTEVTTENVSRINNILTNHYRKRASKPLMFYKFVMNPVSFAQTIENMFYSSFLIKDNFATIKLGEDNLPYIYPVKPDASDSQSSEDDRLGEQEGEGDAYEEEEEEESEDVDVSGFVARSEPIEEPMDTGEDEADPNEVQADPGEVQADPDDDDNRESQACVSINYQEWKWCLEHFNIKRSFIPTLKVSVPT